MNLNEGISEPQQGKPCHGFLLAAGKAGRKEEPCKTIKLRNTFYPQSGMNVQQDPIPVIRPWDCRSLSNVAFYAFPFRTLTRFSAGLGMELVSSYFENASDEFISRTKLPDHPRTKKYF